MNTPAMPAPARGSNVGMIALAFGLLLVGLVAGYFIGKSQVAIAPSSTVSVYPETFENWQAYRNDFGYEFRYPSGWRVKEYTNEYQGTKDVELTNGDLKIQFSINLQTGGENGSMPYPTYSITISPKWTGTDAQTINSILSTFKFTESQKSELKLTQHFSYQDMSGVTLTTSTKKFSEEFPLQTLLMENQQECATTPKSTDYFQELVAKYVNDMVTIYEFSKRGGTYHIIAVPNRPHYKTITEFKEDFDVCAVGGEYPLTLSDNNLIFTTGCGGIASPETEACEEIKTTVETTIKAN